MFRLRLETDATRTHLPRYRRQIEESRFFHLDEVNPDRCQALKWARVQYPALAAECNQVMWLFVWCTMPCPYVVVCTCTIRLEKSYMYVPIAVRGKKLKEMCSSLCGIDYNAILSA